jgi:hypothetical protein
MGGGGRMGWGRGGCKEAVWLLDDGAREGVWEGGRVGGWEESGEGCDGVVVLGVCVV